MNYMCKSLFIRNIIILGRILKVAERRGEIIEIGILDEHEFNNNKEMTWCNNNDSSDDEQPRSDQLHHHQITCSLHHKEISLLSEDEAANTAAAATAVSRKSHEIQTITCPSCGHNFPLEDQGGIINDLPGLPAGVKFDPSDIEILEHLEAKVLSDSGKLHPLIDEFIPTIQGENGICYTHPEKLPGVSKDGQVRHFFHRPSKAYTTGTRKRRKVHTDDTDGGNETRWHKTGKTRAVFSGGTVKGFKKILVLYTNYGRQRKPEKTNWVMHQYHLGNNEEEKDGELVASKVFYQTQPRQCGTSSSNLVKNNLNTGLPKSSSIAGISSSTPSNNVGYYDYNPPPFISYDHRGISHNLVVQGGDESSFIQLPTKQRKT